MLKFLGHIFHPEPPPETAIPPEYADRLRDVCVAVSKRLGDAVIRHDVNVSARREGDTYTFRVDGIAVASFNRSVIAESDTDAIAESVIRYAS